MPSNLRTFTMGKCPNCGQKAKGILYGLVAGDPGDDYVLGGCCLSGGEPDYVCIACDLEFGFGGRNYETSFDLELEFTERETGEKSAELRNINLINLTVDELLSYAPWLIEARHELLHRDFPAEELELIGIQANWKSFPMVALVDVWVYWNRRIQKIEFAAQFFAEGIKHLHGVFLPGSARALRTHSLQEFDIRFSNRQSGITAWNLKSPLPKRGGKAIPQHELLELMIAGSSVSEVLLYRFANPVPDGQMWPAWFDPKQDFKID